MSGGSGHGARFERWARVATVFAAALLSCATPSERYDEAARELGFARRSVEARGVKLVVYEPREPRSGPRLHVYIEGDGLPREAVRFFPPDPTPADPLMLRLARIDRAPAILLGRPCHHAATPCDPRSWMLGRYGEATVSAMVDALRAHLAVIETTEVVLIGFSGGGALAMLMAERFSQAVALVTIAGNLDVTAWASHHGYEPLRDSLDPARRPALPPQVLQLHLLGGRDEEVPPDLVQRAIERQSSAVGRIYPDFDHRCCWESAWPAILSELKSRLARPESELDPAAQREHVRVQVIVPHERVVVEERREPA